jgi:hypothetical protein
VAQIYFLIAVAALLCALGGAATYYMVRAHRSSKNAWRIIVERLQRIDRDKFAAVALDLLDEEDGRQQLDPASIFEMIDGMNGLGALEQNCDVLIDLATYVQRWYPEALQLSEELRINAREIKWHIGRLRGAAQTGHMQEQFPQYAQRAVATYYLMTRSLLVLYEGVQLPEFAELQQAI